MASESPKWIALVLSVLAISISGLSWWESHQNRIVNAEVNRPLLTIQGSFDVHMPRTHMRRLPDEDLFVLVQMTLKNEGKVTAIVSNVKASPNLYEKDGCQISPLSKWDTGPYEPRDRDIEILPQSVQPASTVFAMSLACQKLRYVFFPELVVTVTYSDSANGRQYSQSFQEHVFLNVEDYAE